MDKDLLSIAEARILSETANSQRVTISGYSQPQLNAAALAVLDWAATTGKQMIEQSVTQTHVGNGHDEVVLSEALLPKWRDCVSHSKVVGWLDDDHHQFGVPLGSVAVVLGQGNLVLNTIYAVTIAIKSGNVLVLVPPAKASDVVQGVIQALEPVLQNAGMPPNLVGVMQTVTKEGIAAIVADPVFDLVIDLANPTALATSRPQAKPLFYCGTGASPVFVERTANVKQAVSDIITSASFDNGLLPGAEQFVITEAVVANQVRHELKLQGAHFLSEAEEAKLAQLLQTVAVDSPAITGQSASAIATRAGFSVDPTTKVLVSTQDYVADQSPFMTALPFPLLVFYLEPDWLRACEKCLRLIRKQAHSHTLAIHSNEPKVIEEFATKKPVARMVVNAGAGFGAVGIDTDLPASPWLGAQTASGGGITKGIKACDLTYIRQIGYGEQKVKAAQPAAATTNASQALIDFLSQLANQNNN